VIIPDVNVLVGALQPDDPHHTWLAVWLGQVLNAVEPVGFSLPVLSGTVRVLTNGRIFRSPPAAVDVIAGLDQMLAAPAAVVVTPGRRNWQIFSALCQQPEVSGNLVAHAFHAALAIEHGATFATLDRDFQLFAGLEVVNPVDGA
jgi:hypothetical protein